MNSESPSPKSWPTRVLAMIFLAVAIYSVYLATRLLWARCEGFSCTYLGMAWMFWLAVLCLPTTIFGFFVHRIKSVSARWRRLLLGVWLAHTLFALGLGLTWLVRRF